MPANEGVFDFNILQQLMSFMSAGRSQRYQTSPGGFMGSATQFQQNPLMQMVRQAIPGFQPGFQPFIPYNTSYYDYVLMQERKAQQAQMQTTMPSMFPRLMGWGAGLAGRNPMQTAAMLYQPGGGMTPFGQAALTMYNASIGPILQPEAYINAQRGALLSSFRGLNVGAEGGFYGGLGGEGADRLLGFAANTARTGRGKLRGFSGTDWTDIMRISADYGILTKGGGISISDVEKRVEGIGGVIKIGMAVFNTFKKSKVLDILNTISFGEIDLTSTTGQQSAEMMMLRLSRIAARANKSIQFMTKIAQEGAALYKQMGFSAALGAELYTGQRADFAQGGVYSDKFIRQEGGIAAASALHVQTRMMTTGSGLGRGIYGAYEVIARLDPGAAKLAADRISAEGLTGGTWRYMKTTMARLGATGAEMAQVAAGKYGGRGHASLAGNTGRVSTAIREATVGLRGVVADLNTNGANLDIMWTKAGGNRAVFASRVEAEIHEARPGISGDMARAFAENLTERMIAGEGSIQKGITIAGNRAAKEIRLEDEETKAMALWEEVRPESINLMQRFLSMTLGQTTGGDIVRTLTGGRETAVQARLLRAATAGEPISEAEYRTAARQKILLKSGDWGGKLFGELTGRQQTLVRGALDIWGGHETGGGLLTGEKLETLRLAAERAGLSLSDLGYDVTEEAGPGGKKRFRLTREDPGFFRGLRLSGLVNKYKRMLRKPGDLSATIGQLFGMGSAGRITSDEEWEGIIKGNEDIAGWEGLVKTVRGYAGRGFTLESMVPKEGRKVSAILNEKIKQIFGEDIDYKEMVKLRPLIDHMTKAKKDTEKAAEKMKDAGVDIETGGKIIRSAAEVMDGAAHVIMNVFSSGGWGGFRGISGTAPI